MDRETLIALILGVLKTRDKALQAASQHDFHAMQDMLYKHRNLVDALCGDLTLEALLDNLTDKSTRKVA